MRQSVEVKVASTLVFFLSFFQVLGLEISTTIYSFIIYSLTFIERSNVSQVWCTFITSSRGRWIS